jgi:hypothetical protein
MGHPASWKRRRAEAIAWSRFLGRSGTHPSARARTDGAPGLVEAAEV